MRRISALDAEGNLFKREDLPPPIKENQKKRWYPREKARVVIAVQAGLATLKEVQEWYDLSQEEFDDWKNRLERGGLRALKQRNVRRRRT